MSLNIAQVPTTNKHVGRLRPIRVIVIHTGETSEGPTAAEGMCSWAANPAAGGSFHIAVDTDSACRSVSDKDTAFGAPGVNADGLHLELAGRAGQTTGEWADAASTAILARGAGVVADWSATYSIPMRWLSDAELADGVSKGMATHAQASRVFGGDHWDPGPAFPAEKFLNLCLAAAGQDGDGDMFDDKARYQLDQVDQKVEQIKVRQAQVNHEDYSMQARILAAIEALDAKVSQLAAGDAKPAQ